MAGAHASPIAVTDLIPRPAHSGARAVNSVYSPSAGRRAVTMTTASAPVARSSPVNTQPVMTRCPPPGHASPAARYLVTRTGQCA